MLLPGSTSKNEGRHAFSNQVPSEEKKGERSVGMNDHGP